MLLTPAPGFMMNTLSQGLKAYWQFNDGSGTSAVDSSGNGLTGTLTGDTLPTWTTGHTGNALSFTGDATHSCYVTLGTTPSALQLSGGSMSICAWIYPTGWGGGNLGRIIDCAQAGSTGFRFFISNSTPLGSFTISDVAGGAASSNTGTISSLNTWVHLAATLVSGSQPTFYINGSVVANYAGSTTVSIISSTADFTIGSRYSDNARYFNGSINKIRIYNRVLSAPEISQIYALG